MPRFSYKAYDERGARAAGVVEAETREAAIEFLFRQGRYPSELTEGSAVTGAALVGARAVCGPRPVVPQPGLAHARTGDAGQSRIADRRGPEDRAPATVDAQEHAANGWAGARPGAGRRVAVGSARHSRRKHSAVLRAHRARRGGHRNPRAVAGRPCGVLGTQDRVPRPYRFGAPLPVAAPRRGRCDTACHRDSAGAHYRAPVRGGGSAAAVHCASPARWTTGDCPNTGFLHC